MKGWTAIGVFCEDIREEKSGTETLVGVLPDNMGTDFPAVLPKLCVYIRVHVSIDIEYKMISARMTLLDKRDQSMGSFDANFIKQTQAESRKNGASFSGFIFRALAAIFPIAGPGRLVLTAKVDDEEIVCGSLNIASPPAIASSPPAGQSPTAAS
jgi:hypothetical protein